MGVLVQKAPLQDPLGENCRKRDLFTDADSYVPLSSANGGGAGRAGNAWMAPGRREYGRHCDPDGRRTRGSGCWRNHFRRSLRCGWRVCWSLCANCRVALLDCMRLERVGILDAALTLGCRWAVRSIAITGLFVGILFMRSGEAGAAVTLWSCACFFGIWTAIASKSG